jgi:hypothetical protein
MRMDAEENNIHLRFHPDIDPASAAIAAKQTNNTVTQRMCKDVEERRDKKYQQAELKIQAESSRHPFVPTLISKASAPNMGVRTNKKIECR